MCMCVFVCVSMCYRKGEMKGIKGSVQEVTWKKRIMMVRRPCHTRVSKNYIKFGHTQKEITGTLSVQ